MEGALQVSPPHGVDAQPWSYGEFAVLAGWAFFLWTLTRWSWALVGYLCCTRRISTPRKPGRNFGAEFEKEIPSCFKDTGRDKRRDLPRDLSPPAKREGNRPSSVTPERQSRTSTMKDSPEAKWAQAQILEAMVQRAQPVVQDLQDMHRLGGGGPQPTLRRGSRLP